MQKKIFTKKILQITVASTVTSMLLLTSYFLLEPSVTGAVASDFTIKQTISGELSFVTTPNNVVMDTSINGITGGNSFGTSTVVVRTNNPLGYNLTMNFSSTTAMIHDTASSTIPNYPPSVGGTPDYGWSLSANTAGFGYGVVSVDVDAKFKDDGASACNTGSGNATGTCWYNTSDAQTLVTLATKSSATTGIGATSTIIFQVGVMPNPTIAVPTGGYTATATLTLLDNT